MTKKYREWAPLVLRITIGFGFAAHGWVKFSRGLAGFEKLLTWAGVPLPHLASRLVPFIELLGGISIMAGAFTTIIAFPLICTMLVASVTVQLKFGFSSVNTIGLAANGPKFGPPGYEINLLYIAGLVSLMLTGAGAFSVDRWLLTKKNKKTKKNDA